MVELVADDSLEEAHSKGVTGWPPEEPRSDPVKDLSQQDLPARRSVPFWLC